MSVTLLVMTDGRECIIDAVRSAEKKLYGQYDTLIHDDSGDMAHAEWLRRIFPNYKIHSTGKRSGFGGAIQSAWKLIETDWVFHLEDDFVFNENIYLSDMIEIMNFAPWLAQLALKRQAWNEQEKLAGGIIEMCPEEYHEFSWGPHIWTEHRRFYTTNPSLYRKSLTRRGWPFGEQSEGRFGIDLFKDEKTRCAYLGRKYSPPKVTHIGNIRAGSGY